MKATRARNTKPAPQPVEAAAPPAQAATGGVPITIALLAMIAFVTMVIGNIVSTSPTSDETVHLAGGYTYLRTGEYRLNAEHPPLLKKLAALPLLGMSVWPFDRPGEGTQFQPLLHEAWVMALSKPTGHWTYAHHFLYGVRDATLQRLGKSPGTLPTTERLAKADFLNDAGAMFRRARMAMILPALLLAAVIFLWSRELWGWWGAALSTLLFAFDPNFIAHTGLVTTDVGASCFFAAAVWFFWRATRRFTWRDAILFALSFALAQVSKFSAVLLLPIVFILAFHSRRKLRDVAILIALAGVVTIVTIWAAYGFRFTMVKSPEAQAAEEEVVKTRLIDPTLEAPGRWPTGHPHLRNTLEEWAATKALQPQYAPEQPPFEAVRRIMSTRPLPLSARIIVFFETHRFLPETYLHGLAVVRLGSLARSTFLNGQQSTQGFRSYFFWTTLYKTPLPLLAALIAGLVVAFRRRVPGALPFLVWPVVVLVGVAVLSSINIGHRHILPAFPFLYIACGALALVWQQWPERKRLVTAIAVIALLLIPTLVVFSIPLSPMWGRHLSYMNEVAGGPVHGWKRLIDSNLDWGQDLPRLDAFLREQGAQEPVTLLYFGTAEPQYYGLSYVNAPLGYFARPEVQLSAVQPKGWVAISVNTHNGFLFAADSRTYWRDWLEKNGAQEVGRAGYSIFVYRF